MPDTLGSDSRLANDPQYAAKYLNAALQDSNQAFLVALRDVAEARKMAAATALSGTPLNRVGPELGEVLAAADSVCHMLYHEDEALFKNITALLTQLGMGLRVEAQAAPKAT